ncbi:O-antigen ligase [Streptomyces sp. Y2F8-2]|uniref:O-antigen ligase family protein n=1 Tax=Streptomyces sp. Y2F8-2 TaxID=2759675 RepID=UPI001903CDDB|nr:O-antigen ligase family protein [Streptomyces sp. Y2F8-2]
MVGAALSVPLISALQITHVYRYLGVSGTSTPDGASLAGIESRAWLGAAAVAIVVLLGMLLPPALLLAGAVVLSHGLGIAALRTPLVGPLLISDVLLLIHMLRTAAQQRREAERNPAVGLWLALFLGWSFLATLWAGVSVTPLLRIAVYGAVFLLLSRGGTDRKLFYRCVLCYALCNLVGGVALGGQQRLVGLDIGDPAQTGALLLAALCPLLTSELRFRGRWVVGAALLYGIFLTQTRSVWFATVVLFAVWAQRRLSVSRLVLLLMGTGLLALQMLDSVTQWLHLNSFSAVIRRESVINGLRSGLEHPVLGSGWGHASFADHVQASGWQAVRQSLPYNLFVNLFASVGLPGLLAFVFFLWGLLRRLVRRRDAPLLFTLALLAMSLTEMTLYSGSMATLLLFIYSGMGLGPAGRVTGGTPGSGWKPPGPADRDRAPAPGGREGRAMTSAPCDTPVAIGGTGRPEIRTRRPAAQGASA